MVGFTLDLQLQVKEKNDLQESSLIEIEKFVEEIIKKNKKNAVAINTLVLDSVSMLSAAEARSGELANQRASKKLWNGLTGKNIKIRGEIDRNLAAAQYASQQMIQKLAEQNLMTFELITTINNRLSTMLNEVDAELNEVYATLINFFKQIKSNIVQLESRIETIEQNVNLLHWHNTIEYQMMEDKEYVELPEMEKFLCLASDFYMLTKGRWSTADLMLLKSTMAEVGINLKAEVSYQDFFTSIIEKPILLERLLKESDLKKAISIEPHQAILIKGLEKYNLLQAEESYIVETVVSVLENSNRKYIRNSLLSNYLKSQAICDIDKSIRAFDFMNELLLNLSMFFNLEMTKTFSDEEQYLKIQGMKNKIDIQKRKLISLHNEKIEAKRRLVRINSKNERGAFKYFPSTIYTLKWKKDDNTMVEMGELIGIFPQFANDEDSTNKIYSPSQGRLHFIKGTGANVEDEEVVAIVTDPEDKDKDIEIWLNTILKNEQE